MNTVVTMASQVIGVRVVLEVSNAGAALVVHRDIPFVIMTGAPCVKLGGATGSAIPPQPRAKMASLWKIYREIIRTVGCVVVRHRWVLRRRERPKKRLTLGSSRLARNVRSSVRNISVPVSPSSRPCILAHLLHICSSAAQDLGKAQMAGSSSCSETKTERERAEVVRGRTPR